MKHNWHTITALVIAGMRVNWSRHYLRSRGYSAGCIESIVYYSSDGRLMVGNVLKIINSLIYFEE